MVCDNDNVVIYTNTGGMVVPEKDVDIRVKPDSPTTAVRRKGNTYSMDAWVKTSAEATGFTGQGTTKLSHKVIS